MVIFGISIFPSGKLHISQEDPEGLFKDGLSFFVFLFCVFAILSQVLLVVFSWSKLPPQVPVFYSKPWGEEILSSPFMLLLLPGLNLIFFAVNYLILTFIVRESPFLSKTLVLFSLLVSLIAFYGTFKIIFLLT
jgi:hypothetical protein